MIQATRLHRPNVISAKRHIGDGKTQWEIAGKTYSPVDVSALIIEKLKKAADTYLNQNTGEAVVTVPAYFNNNQKRDTKLAVEAAGLKVLRLLPEPTSAAIAYAVDKGKDQIILVYDLGGGTFDVSVLTVQGNQCRVLAVDGDFQLGGDDFDMAIVYHLLGILENRSKADIGILRLLFGEKNQKALGTEQELLLARQKIKEAAERAKIELSESDTTQVIIPQILGTTLDEEIHISEYNKMISPLVDRTVQKIQDVLRSANMTADDIDALFLLVDPPGTCWSKISITPIELIDVTPFSLGVIYHYQ